MRKRGSLEERVFIVDGSFHRADGPVPHGFRPEVSCLYFRVEKTFLRMPHDLSDLDLRSFGEADNPISHAKSCAELRRNSRRAGYVFNVGEHV